MRTMVGLALAAAAASVSGAPVGSATVIGNEDPARVMPGYTTVAEAWSGVAPCLGGDESTAAARFAVAPADASATAKVSGLTLTDAPERLDAFRALARRMDKAALARARDADCQDVACAAEAAFGTETASQIVSLAVRYHYVAVDKKTAWDADELDELAASLSDLPDGWFGGKDYRLLVRRHGDSWTPTPTPPSLTLVAMAGAGLPGVLVQDGWATLRPTARRAAIVHEMAHEFSRRQSGGWRRGWMAAEAADEALMAGEGRTSAVSAYAETNPEEDFAESVAAYRYMPPALIRRAPNRYAFLKAQVFGGLEYGSAAKCRRDYAAAVLPMTGR
jgi:hypothetical protein